MSVPHRVIDDDALSSVYGGMRWEDLPMSGNVIDMRGVPLQQGLPYNWVRTIENDYLNYLDRGDFSQPYTPASPAARAVLDQLDQYQRENGRPIPGAPPPNWDERAPEPEGERVPYGAPGSLEDQLGVNDIPNLGRPNAGGGVPMRHRFEDDTPGTTEDQPSDPPLESPSAIDSPQENFGSQEDLAPNLDAPTESGPSDFVEEPMEPAEE